MTTFPSYNIFFSHKQVVVVTQKCHMIQMNTFVSVMDLV